MTRASAIADPPAPAAPVAAPKPPAKLGPVAQWWLRRLFTLSRNAPWMARLLRDWAARTAIRYHTNARESTAANAHRLIDPALSDMECRAFGRAVVRRFIDFVIDIGRSQGQTPEQLRAHIDSVQGHDAYLAARAPAKGAIILTAHMGSFELGLAALTAIEPHVHVVFKRDNEDSFEALRRNLRTTLGVHEAAVDDGWTTWLALRDALRANHVVILQGDRAMPGQKSQPVPIARGHVALPMGPLMLAIASGAPIVPIFTLATTPGRCKVFVETAIEVDPDAAPVDGVHPAMRQIAAVLEKYLIANPNQWLMLEPAFAEDIASTKQRAQ
ncbi:hypothetical protein BH10PLA1_BH10PLA1_05120 [soil metagenome]